MHRTDIRIREALENAEANIALLAAMPDKKLAQKLDTIHLQSGIAMRNKITPSVELLEIWRSQVIAARIYKAENEIPDAPNEIELAIADIETYVSKTEERQEVLNEPSRPKGFKTEVHKDDDSQISLF